MTNKMRALNQADRVIQHIDQTLSFLCNRQSNQLQRPNPAISYPEAKLLPQQIKNTIGLMRVNHSGEIAAQGLYQGQALTAKLVGTREHMEKAALEEIDHLTWCYQRLTELGGRSSYLDPIWYLGALLMGAGAGLIGDHWSLGFIAETERQVSAHLENHLSQLAQSDQKTQSILLQMKEDEERHAQHALESGGNKLPQPIKFLMRLASKLMVTTAYYF